jgi:hypothetical protein
MFLCHPCVGMTKLCRDDKSSLGLNLADFVEQRHVASHLLRILEDICERQSPHFERTALLSVTVVKIVVLFAHLGWRVVEYSVSVLRTLDSATEFRRQITRVVLQSLPRVGATAHRDYP